MLPVFLGLRSKCFLELEAPPNVTVPVRPSSEGAPRVQDSDSLGAFPGVIIRIKSTKAWGTPEANSASFKTVVPSLFGTRD